MLCNGSPEPLIFKAVWYQIYLYVPGLQDERIWRSTLQVSGSGDPEHTYKE